MIICFVVLGIQLQTFVLQENIPALSLLWLLLAAAGSQSPPLFISRVLMMLLDADKAPCRLAINFSFLMLSMRVWFTEERAHHSTVSAIHTTYRCAVSTEGSGNRSSHFLSFSSFAFLFSFLRLGLSVRP